MEGANYVTCPRCEMHVVFASGAGKPPETCPHCARRLEGFRAAMCDACGGRWQTAAAAGAEIPCPHCGAKAAAPAEAGETAVERRHIPARVRAAAEGGPLEAVVERERFEQVARELEAEKRARRRLLGRALAGGAPAAALAVGGGAWRLAGGRWDIALAAAAAAALAWAAFVCHAARRSRAD